MIQNKLTHLPPLSSKQVTNLIIFSMKKIFLLLGFLIASVAFVNAQTMSVHLSGTVTSDSSGAPVANHEVIITSDSSSGFIFYASRLTNPNGFYDCTIQNVPTASAITFFVKTHDCHNLIHQESFLSTSSPAVVNFVICTQSLNCEAAFTFYHDSTNLLSFHFNSTSYIPAGTTIISYSWDFGDGTTAFTQDPWHTYAVYGVYHVCLTIATSTGCTSIKCQEVNASTGGCEARYEFVRDSTNQLRIHFWDTSTIPAGSHITARQWTFGDGGTATTGDPWHTYLHAGIYNVCLTIYTSTGCISTKCDSIEVGGTPVNCESWFTYTKNLLTVSFEGHTHSTLPTSWVWNFGDPISGVLNTSTFQFPTHTYSAPGTYVVSLHTVDGSGCEHSSYQEIYVHGTVDINGAVHIGNHFVDHGLIQLIRVDSNNVMTVFDSKEFGDSAGMYWFGGVPAGHYYLKAELLPSSAFYGQYVPTYYHEALNWTGADLIEIGQPVNPYNFGLMHVNGPLSGNGNISGTITQGSKVNAGGTAAANVEVLLLDGQNVALTCVKTDINGHFEFPDVALGSYIIWPEVPGLQTTPAHITLNAVNPSVILPFSMTGSEVIYGISDNLPDYFTRVGEIFPNPLSNSIAGVKITVTRALTIDLSLYNLTGQIVRNSKSVVHQGDNLIRMDLSTLPAGPYYLKLSSSEGGSVVKKLSVVK